MNKISPRSIFAGSALLLFGLVLLTTPGCHKDKPCHANVTVVHASDNSPVGGAYLLLQQNPPPSNQNPNSVLTAYCDGSGKASFTTSLPMILDISVQGPGYMSSPYYPTGKVARFDAGKTDEVTVAVPW